MKALTDLQPGDKIAIERRTDRWHKAPAIKHEIATVLRATKTLLICEPDTMGTHRKDMRVNIATGRIQGDAWDYFSNKIVHADEAILATNKDQREANRVWSEEWQRLQRMVHFFERLHKQNLTVDQMRALSDAFDKITGTTTP